MVESSSFSTSTPVAGTDMNQPSETSGSNETITPRRLYKKVLRPKNSSTQVNQIQESTAETQTHQNEEVILVRVRRQRESEPLEALELSFEQASNVLKRQRLVTQADALVDQFNASVQLDSNKRAVQAKNSTASAAEEETKSGFALGAKN